MNVLKQYSIPWKGLKNGKHEFDFKVDGRFFEAFGNGDIRDGHAEVSVVAEKGAAMLSLGFRITGEVTVECDRCMEELALPVDYSGELTVKFSDETDEYDGEVMWLSPSEPAVELGQYIYESILLSLPYRKIHGEDAEGRSLCDPEMLSRFRIVTQEEFDDITADARTLERSPQGEKLKRLKEKESTDL